MISAFDKVTRLKNGETITSREPGNSMLPLIKSRQPVTIAPVDPDKLEPGDIVYAKVGGRLYTHLVFSVEADRVQIGNNQGHSNGWTSKAQVFGIVVEIDGIPRPKAQGKVKS